LTTAVAPLTAKADNLEKELCAVSVLFRSAPVNVARGLTRFVSSGAQLGHNNSRPTSKGRSVTDAAERELPDEEA